MGGRNKKRKNHDTERFFLIDDIFVVDNKNNDTQKHDTKQNNVKKDLEKTKQVVLEPQVNKEQAENVNNIISVPLEDIDTKEVEDLPEVKVKVHKKSKIKKNSSSASKKSDKNKNIISHQSKKRDNVNKQAKVNKRNIDSEIKRQSNDATAIKLKSKTENKVSNAFLESLKNFSATSIEDSGIQYKKRRNYSLSLIRGGILAVCIGVFIYSAFQIGNSILNSIKAQQIQSQIQSEFYNDSEISPANISLKSTRTYTLMEMLGADEDGITFTPPELQSLYQTLKKQLTDTLRTGKYPDGYAWVKVPGTNIDYLVVLPDDNEQYLYLAPNGTYNKSGSIFADYRTNENYLSNRHVVLYGHNMTDGTMFGSVRQFFISNEQWKMFTSTEIQVITEDGLYIYKPFSLYKATLGNNYIRYEFDNDDQWVEFLQSIYDQSIFKQWTTSYKQYIKPSTRILTFSTCTNNLFDEHERYVLHAVLVNVITDDTQ